MGDNGNSLNPSSKFINQVRSNTKSDLIEITEDKLENILIKFIEKFKKMFDFIKKNFGKVKVISGLILIGMGIYMIAF